MTNELFNFLNQNKKDIQTHFSNGLLTINPKNEQNKNTIACSGLLMCEDCPFYFEDTEFIMFSCHDDKTQNIIIDYVKKEFPEILL